MSKTVKKKTRDTKRLRLITSGFAVTIEKNWYSATVKFKNSEIEPTQVNIKPTSHDPQNETIFSLT